ncbi:MAG: site-specific integrase [bacterium]
MVRIYQRGKKGTYWIDYVFDGQRRREPLGVTNKPVAEKRLVEAREALARGERPGAGRTVELGELLDRYLEWCADVCLNTDKTLYDKKRYIRRYIKFWGTGRKVVTLKRADVEAYMGRRRKESGSVILPNRELQTLRHFFNFAKSRDIIIKNPCGGVKRFPGEELYRKPIRKLDLRDVQTWLAYLTEYDEVLYDLSILAIYSGQRPGDILAIKGADIQDGIWYVRQRKKHGKVNEAPLLGPAAQVVERRKVLYGKGYLFPGRKPVTHLTTYRRPFKTAKQDLGLEFDFKDFRHLYANILAAIGTPSPEIKNLMGHSRITTTERYLGGAGALGLSKKAAVGKLVAFLEGPHDKE